MSVRMKQLYLALPIVLSLGGASVNAREVIPLKVDAQNIAATQAMVGDQPGLFMFDSGIGTSSITPATAKRIGCIPWGKVTGFRAIGERLDLSRCNTTSVTVGAFRVSMPQVVVIDLEKFMGPSARKFSGILGLDLFAGQIVTLDVADNRVVLEDHQSLAEIRRAGTEVPIRLVRAAEGAALTVDLGVPTRQGLLWMEIDTGNYGPSLIDRKAAALVSLDASKTTRQDWRVTPKPGLESSGTAVVRDLILDGDLGRDVLRHWVVTVDLATGHGWIKQSKQ
ncbi:retropepsin-like aspartic protease [Gluconobacter kondonii]|uniref:retropepsin-like aspartic protease n=1 Tax=Gluconobacter kondonii TaxID=941463 RepID=UPI001B8C91E3|nr:retropepsin-like aspartic protease [Gluconobacter kondonii]